ncbi:MAG: hypothetical protein FWB86_08120 [Treponema sp.]|nr:hypothetical protein [Treponema sp.]MCL2251949.1 hypothetical protein [Treponema sp.]
MLGEADDDLLDEEDDAEALSDFEPKVWQVQNAKAIIAVMEAIAKLRTKVLCLFFI